MLWRKVAKGLSAGRVQSAATRIVVERERKRMRFRSASWCSVEGSFSRRGPAFATASGRGRRPPRRDRRGLLVHRHARRFRRGGSSSTLRQPRDLSQLWTTPSSRWPASRSAPTGDLRRLRSSPRRSNRRPPASCASRPSGRCRSPSTCTSAATSPTCAPTRRRCPTPRSEPHTARPPALFGVVRSRATRRVPQQGEERPGSPRGDPARRRQLPHPRSTERRAARRGAQAVRARVAKDASPPR